MIYQKADIAKLKNVSPVKQMIAVLPINTRRRIKSVKLYSPSATEIIDKMAVHIGIYIVDENGKTLLESLLEPALTAWEANQRQDLRGAYHAFTAALVRNLPIILGFKATIERVQDKRLKGHEIAWDCLSMTFKEWLDLSDWVSFEVSGRVDPKWLENENLGYAMAHTIIPHSSFACLGVPSVSDRHAS
ncbi:hypothetical protein K6Y31_21225 [Motilimonas cestriensis]|uniref:Uncharacterized protein n=1 Tax=Motilimonas cestriensis TaxID=2742685 RepID=A0ABS8WFF2_9GAMM|nr:hypothetical protein [Motilimonas cestriensis]MCE2597298.1 hypothetical protein [Motilimonas cestriensis]